MNERLKDKIVENAHAWIARTGMTQAELARRSKLEPNTLNQMLNKTQKTSDSKYLLLREC